ncbi:MAG: class I SAM-dependent methyltransferase [Chloroflexi bacterium]|nr:class I SAM-dependent methyltransferase [Chloroflexota bacterium]MCY3696608.1 class I SAM-dependent methyltransferase [Chloroflexota bacterium]
MPTEVDEQRSGNPREALRDYHQIQQLSESQEDAARIEEQPKLVSRFYDAVTRFYVFGWGTTFHFSPRRPGESLVESQRRHDEEVGEILQLKPGMEVADLGCGVGGPMITIGRASGANITGINFSPEQISRGERLVAKAGLSDTCRFLYANFMDVPLEDETFDAVYSFEAVCHAPNNLLLFQELYRLVKPGGEIAIVDWCFTDRYEPDNPRHQQIRRDIETNNAVPDLLSTERQVETVQEAGFEIIQAIDQQAEYGNPDTPWYMALQGRDFSFTSWARTPIGRGFTATVTKFLEFVRLAPSGTSETASFLNVAADALVEGGELEIFTPSFLVHARKPASQENSSS